MLLFRFLLLSLLTALLLGFAQCKKCNSQDSCCAFVTGFPVRLKALRSSYIAIQDYYESRDDLDTALFNSTILEYLISPYGCNVMNDVLLFYLDTVLPRAFEGHTKNVHQKHIENIRNIFNKLKRELVKCRNYFRCLKPFEISSVNNTYSQMGDKGLYKAMAELDMLFNYIEDYMKLQRS